MNLCEINAKRVIIMPKDIQLLQNKKTKIKEYCH